ncbi:IS256 family transposase [Slackia isoflavoniconvertens]|uniref:IS256 family transposase n=1 Tax=Slackia isoflavoniconvertens TaxID=572010 RepID=UPI003AB9AD14
MTATNALHQDIPATGGESFDLQALTRALVESALNAIMDEQAGMACEGGANSRNGYRERGLVTPADKITLRIPKLRCGTYFPEGMLERHGRADKAVAAAVAEMYANGVSTRKVERIARRMGIDRLSSSQVSRICKRLDAEVAALRAREFDMAMPRLFLDVTYVKCRRVVGLSAIDAETYAGWLGFCRDLRMRGVGGVKCVTSDAHEGLRRTIAECFPGAAWQRRIAHLERNVCSMLPSKRQRKAAGKVMQAVLAQEDPAMVRAACHAAIDAISSFSQAAAGLLEDAECDALAYLAFPAEHRRRIRTNNVQERTSREIKRRTRAVQVFPSVESMIRLVGAVMAERLVLVAMESAGIAGKAA